MHLFYIQKLLNLVEKDGFGLRGQETWTTGTKRDLDRPQ